MKSLSCALVLLFAVSGIAQDAPVDLTGIVSAAAERIDHADGDVHINITVNLTVAFNGSTKFITSFCLSALTEGETVKNGTAAQKAALRKKYVRQAVREYLAAKAASLGSNTNRGSTNVSK